MRIVLQRVSRASVSVGGREVGRIGRGVCLLAGITHDDTAAEAAWMAEKVAGLRIFADAERKMNLALGEVGGAVLAISQFTLYGDATKGRRPSFVAAAGAEAARPVYDALVDALRARGIPVSTGEFGADMQVEMHNDGPVTILLERSAS